MPAVTIVETPVADVAVMWLPRSDGRQLMLTSPSGMRSRWTEPELVELATAVLAATTPAPASVLPPPTPPIPAVCGCGRDIFAERRRSIIDRAVANLDRGDVAALAAQCGPDVVNRVRNALALLDKKAGRTNAQV